MQRSVRLSCGKLLLTKNGLKSLTASAVGHSHQSAVRCLSTTQAVADPPDQGWFSKLLTVRKIDPGKESHSSLLADADVVYELQTHNVRPGSMGQYLELYKNYVQRKESIVGLDSEQMMSIARAAGGGVREVVTADRDMRRGAEFVGSWQTVIGDEDQVINVWRYRGGWATASHVQEQLADPQNKDLVMLRNELGHILRSRKSQLAVAFSFWGHPEVPSLTNSWYELRSYTLKPGTMIEWGNNWARGLQYRKSSAVLGMFSQIGQLYMVHHMWRYDNLLARKEFREDAWRKPGWDECVAHTVPLIREMTSRWMSPNEFSRIR